jgi:hypothetical protein
MAENTPSPSPNANPMLELMAKWQRLEDIEKQQAEMRATIEVKKSRLKQVRNERDELWGTIQSSGLK